MVSFVNWAFCYAVSAKLLLIYIQMFVILWQSVLWCLCLFCDPWLYHAFQAVFWNIIWRCPPCVGFMLQHNPCSLSLTSQQSRPWERVGKGKSFFQPILFNYIIRNDIGRVKVSLFIKDRMLDDSCHHLASNIHRSLFIARYCAWAKFGRFVKEDKIGKPPRMVLIPDTWT